MNTASLINCLLHFMQIFITCTGIRECIPRSQWCVGSADLPHIFPCVSRGRLPHPSNMTLYLHCQGPGFHACVCTCQYQDMCYDRDSRTCKFTYLDPDANCGTQVIPISERGSYDVTTSSTVKDNLRNHLNNILQKNPPAERLDKEDSSKSNPVKEQGSSKFGHNLKVQDKHWKVNDQNEVVEHHNEIYVTNTGSPSDASKDVLAVKETSKPYKLTVIEDESLFPAWAIALVVLCLVIVVMLIVLIMY